LHPFEYVRASSVEEALAAARPGSRYLAGGTNLLDLMKGGVETPARVIDINRLALGRIEESRDGGLRIGALVRNSDCAAHPWVTARYPLLAEALLAGASPQLRNMASIGGNLLQRTRCHYFVDTAFDKCNKRTPGSGCAARQGENRIHAILGASPACVATHPSDMAVALVALDARVDIAGPRGKRTLPVEELLRLPGDTPERENELAEGELVVAVELPPAALARQHYLKVRDRASFSFALVSVAVALDRDDGRVRDVRIALGGVAHKPWRAREAEDALRGLTLDRGAIESAAALGTAAAEPLARNAFKVELARRSLARALAAAAGVA
jgi:xanthine dehydrogenase YagS FAD-binding subunit